MKHLKILLSLVLIPVIFNSCHQSEKLLRIAIAGLAIESSTFSPALTREEAFHVKTGDEIFNIYPFFSADSPERQRADWFPNLKGHALPGGTVTREAYESLVKKTLAIPRFFLIEQ